MLRSFCRRVLTITLILLMVANLTLALASLEER